jgi:hypothetical protein
MVPGNSYLIQYGSACTSFRPMFSASNPVSRKFNFQILTLHILLPLLGAAHILRSDQLMNICFISFPSYYYLRNPPTTLSPAPIKLTNQCYNTLEQHLRTHAGCININD